MYLVFLSRICIGRRSGIGWSSRTSCFLGKEGLRLLIRQCIAITIKAESLKSKILDPKALCSLLTCWRHLNVIVGLE